MVRKVVQMIARCAYCFGIALVWLLVIALGLEVFERGRVLIAERAYERYFEAQNRKVYRMAPLEELKRPEHQFTIPQSDRGWAVSVPASPTIAKESVRQSREDYAGQSPEHRSVILALQGELHLCFTRDGTLLEAHGEPLLEQYLRRYLGGESDWEPRPDWQAVFDAIRTVDAVTTFRTHYVETTFPMLPHHYMVTVAPRRDERDIVEVIAREITDALPIEAQILSEPPPESPWEKPFFSYKKNWTMPESILSTNNYGFRDDDVVLPKPPGVFRIVCVGGSTTEEGNDNASTYPNIMERKLREWLNTDKIDVVNAGLCGLTSYTERRRINDYLDLEPDLILYYNAVNDVCHKHFPIWLDAPNPWRSALNRSRLLRRIFNRRLLPPDDVLAAFMNATTMRNLRAMAVAARERNVQMAVCSFAYPTISWHHFRARRYYDVNLREVWHGGPLYFSTYRQIMALYNRVLKRMCENEGILYVPVAERFVAGDDHFFDICHMTPIGLELKTNIIGAYIRDFLVSEGVVKNEMVPRDSVGSGRS